MSEFDDWAYENGLSRTKDEDGYFSKNTEYASKAWQHQQAKVDELQNLYTQQGINMLKLQKRVDAALKQLWRLRILKASGSHVLDEIEQALKGEI